MKRTSWTVMVGVGERGAEAVDGCPTACLAVNSIFFYNHFQEIRQIVFININI